MSLTAYLTALRDLRATGAAVAETSFYPALAALLDAIGSSLTPPVRCVGQLANFLGAGSPDFGFYSADQFPRKADLTAKPAPGLLPARGVLEAKGTTADLDALAAGPQVRKYLDAFGLVLVTNYRDFLLVARGPGGAAVPEERYVLAPDEAGFWAAVGKNPAALAARHEVGLGEFLRRALLHEAPLSRPPDVAFFLASYARHALQLLDEKADLPALAAVRATLEEALGIRFEGDRGEHFFRSTLVQTLFYGVFSAWVLWCRRNPPPAAAERFDWRLASWSLQVPILRTLFVQLTDPGKLQPLGLVPLLDWTSAALNRVDRPAFFTAFEGGGGDAVQYFYEPFLAAFDPELRRQLGVWYTPREIVRYQVARVDQLLKSELGLPAGLADPNVYVLDPCCGTGAYLVETLRRVEENLRADGSGDILVAADLKKAARERLFGFELIPAPFVVAHLQLGLFLARAGAPLAGDERAAVFLTNALSGWEPPAAERAPLLFAELEEERSAADRVKRARPILVILGNPPYNGFAGVAPDEGEERREERDLSDAYRTPRPGLPAPQGQGLNDLYVRFFRMAERRITQGKPGRGIVSFISNYSWLDGLSHSVMRDRYLEAFDEVWIDNLNGDKYKTGKLTPDGQPDPSAFSTESNREGIQVGTAVATLVRRGERAEPAQPATVYFRHYWGKEKRAELIAGAEPFKPRAYQTLKPARKLGLPFVPLSVEASYLRWPRLTELLPANFPGVKTSRDEFLVAIDRAALEERIACYFDASLSDEEIARRYPGVMHSTPRFDAKATRRTLTQRGFIEDSIVRFCYRPFDVRWLYWESETKLLDEKRTEYFEQIFPSNLWIEARQKQTKADFDRGYVTRVMADTFGNGCSNFFPLLLSDAAILNGHAGPARPNLSPTALKYLAGLAPGANGQSVPPDSLFYHAVATFHAPAYRAENAGALRQDWPRLPLPVGRDALLASAALGRRVAALLDPETPVPDVTGGGAASPFRQVAHLTVLDQGAFDAARNLAVTAGWGHFGQGGAVMPGRGRLEPSDGPDAGPGDCRVFLNPRLCWDNVPRAVWDFTLGGYPVLKKWLSYREQPILGRPLHPEEAREFTAIARRLAALLSLGPDLDASYRAASAEGE